MRKLPATPAASFATLQMASEANTDIVVSDNVPEQDQILLWNQTKPNQTLKFIWHSCWIINLRQTPLLFISFSKQINSHTFICKKTKKIYEWNVKYSTSGW